MRGDRTVKAYVIRVWTPDDEVEGHGHERSELRGVVEQVGSNQPTTFKNDDELLGLLREQQSALAPIEKSGSRRR
jgi:hypothetical protein